MAGLFFRDAGSPRRKITITRSARQGSHTFPITIKRSAKQDRLLSILPVLAVTPVLKHDTGAIGTGDDPQSVFIGGDGAGLRTLATRDEELCGEKGNQEGREGTPGELQQRSWRV